MFYVYILQSINTPEHFYTGMTSDLKRRFREHNDGLTRHTNKFKPWRLSNYIAFQEKEKAENFEMFLKSGYGREFARKHF
jgi:predicted GIY-YIG superfamily endonuclease